jgi:hypothetical protein
MLLRTLVEARSLRLPLRLEARNMLVTGTCGKVTALGLDLRDVIKFVSARLMTLQRRAVSLPGGVGTRPHPWGGHHDQGGLR